MPPLFGRLKISQSRKLPQPPSETVPVPIPPRGNAISRSDSLVKRRAGREATVRGLDCPRARPAAAEAANILRLVIFIRLPQNDVREPGPTVEMLPNGQREIVRANRGARGRPARVA